MSLHWPLKTFDGQLAAVLGGHRPLDALDDRGGRAAVVLELLGAVVDVDPRPLAQVLVVGALVGVLEPAPAADVVDQDRVKSALPVCTSSIIAFKASRPSIFRPLLPSSA